jgi:hypothetical protein
MSSPAALAGPIPQPFLEPERTPPIMHGLPPHLYPEDPGRESIDVDIRRAMTLHQDLEHWYAATDGLTDDEADFLTVAHDGVCLLPEDLDDGLYPPPGHGFPRRGQGGSWVGEDGGSF